MNVDALASEAFREVPAACLAGVMDLETGLFLSLKPGDCDLEQADLLAASAREIFDGPASAGLRCSLDGRPDEQSVDLVVVVANAHTFVFTRVGSDPSSALVVACGRGGGLGVVLSRARQVARNG
jgi:hypothetical protein